MSKMIGFVYLLVKFTISKLINLCLNCEMDIQKLIKSSASVMSELAQKLGQSVALLSVDEDRALGVVLCSVDGTSGLVIHMNAGLEFPLQTSAPGKSFMAHLSEERRQLIYEKIDFKAYTPNSILTTAELDLQLAEVLKSGFGFDASEENDGVNCVGVPIFDENGKIVSAIWSSARSAVYPIRVFPEVASVLKIGAEQIMQNLASMPKSFKNERNKQVIEKACEIIESNLNGSIDARDLANQLFVSYAWFRRTFKEEVGEAPAEFHQKLRLEKACELLETTDLSIRVISEDLGFVNQNHFSALFKRKVGLSPLNYRLKKQSI